MEALQQHLGFSEAGQRHPGACSRGVRNNRGILSRVLYQYIVLQQPVRILMGWAFPTYFLWSHPISSNERQVGEQLLSSPSAHRSGVHEHAKDGEDSKPDQICRMCGRSDVYDCSVNTVESTGSVSEHNLGVDVGGPIAQLTACQSLLQGVKAGDKPSESSFLYAFLCWGMWKGL